jgi:hypothetical protein
VPGTKDICSSIDNPLAELERAMDKTNNFNNFNFFILLFAGFLVKKQLIIKVPWDLGDTHQCYKQHQQHKAL